MINDVIYLPLVAGELALIIMILLICFAINLKKLKEENEKLYKEKREWISKKSKLSMIESKVREYKEQNKNPITILRDIQNILWKEEEN